MRDSLLPALGFRALAGIALAGMYMPGLHLRGAVVGPGPMLIHTAGFFQLLANSSLKSAR
jgi:hypothetical protein